jgi:hypothetical protein
LARRRGPDIVARSTEVNRARTDSDSAHTAMPGRCSRTSSRKAACAGFHTPTHQRVGPWDELHTDDFAVGFLPLDPGQSMILLYDFGDCWRFTVKLEKILPQNSDFKRAKIIEKKGKAPQQYKYSDG